MTTDGDSGPDRDRRAHSYQLRSMGCLSGKAGAGSKADKDDEVNCFPKCARDLSESVIDFDTSAAHEEGVVIENQQMIVSATSAIGVFSAEEEAAIVNASDRKRRLKPHVCSGGRRVQSGGKSMLELSEKIGVTRVNDSISWEAHPFSYKGDDRIAYEAYLQFHRHRADLQVTRALLQQKSWKPSKVHSDDDRNCIHLKRFDGLKLTVRAKSHNRLCAIYESTGLILGLVDSIQSKGGKFVVLFHRVHTTKDAVIEVVTEADLVIAQGSLGGIHPLTHTFRGRQYLQRLLVLEKHGLKYPDQTFHPGKKLYRINAENIVSEVGWVPENYELENAEAVRQQLNVGGLFGDINWVYLGDSFNDEPTEGDQVDCLLCFLNAKIIQPVIFFTHPASHN